MEKFKLGINSDRIDLHVAGSLIVAALQMENIELIPKPRWNETDLLLNIDSIHNTQLFRGKKLTAYWEIDDNLHQGKNEQYYNVDLLYICSKQRLFQYPKYARYLPVAMEPTIHYRWETIPMDYDIAFLGNLSGNQVYSFRKQVIEAFKERYNCLFGTCQPQDYAKMLSQGKLLFNILPQLENDIPLVNARFMESMGIGCLLNNYNPVLDDFAQEGRDYVGFTTIGEAMNKVDYLLANDEARQIIANNARANVLAHHTWEIRLTQIINDARNL